LTFSKCFIHAEAVTFEGVWLDYKIASYTADHGRADWLGYWDEFVQKGRFKKLVCLCHIKQNNLTYLGRV